MSMFDEGVCSSWEVGLMSIGVSMTDSETLTQTATSGKRLPACVLLRDKVRVQMLQNESNLMGGVSCVD
jgi:hypothetical protein